MSLLHHISSMASGEAKTAPGGYSWEESMAHDYIRRLADASYTPADFAHELRNLCLLPPGELTSAMIKEMYSRNARMGRVCTFLYTAAYKLDGTVIV